MCDSHLLSLRIPLRISFLHPFCSDVDLAFVSWNSFMAVLFPFLRLASCLLISSACDVCFVGFIFKKERGKRGSQSSAVDVQNSGTSLHALARGHAGPMHAPPLPSRAFSVGVELTSGSLWCRSAGVLSARRRAREISTRWAESSDFDLQLPARAGDSVYIWWQRWRRREGGGGFSRRPMETFWIDMFLDGCCLGLCSGMCIICVAIYIVSPCDCTVLRFCHNIWSIMSSITETWI